MARKSSIYTSLLLRPPPRFPPNNTAWWSVTIVREKSLQGGGLLPVTLGEDHVPRRNNPYMSNGLGISLIKIGLAPVLNRGAIVEMKGLEYRAIRDTGTHCKRACKQILPRTTRQYRGKFNLHW